jgi:hypothetical protein
MSGMTEHTQPYGVQLRDARNAKGYSLDEMAFRARTELGRPVTPKKIARMEDGTTSEAGADAPLFVTLCHLSDLDPWEVSESIAARAEGDARVLVAWAGDHLPPGRRIGPVAA